MKSLKRIYPFNLEQTVNILSEFGPLITMFVVNAAYGITAGTWALLATTVIAIVAMRIVLKRLPAFPLIASSVTLVFGALTIITHNPMWVQIKVTIFNAMFAAFLIGGLYLNKNFFKYVFEKTFHYTKEGWDRFTWSFAWFFIFTAVANEMVRLTFKDNQMYSLLGYQMDGVNVWILSRSQSSCRCRRFTPTCSPASCTNTESIRTTPPHPPATWAARHPPLPPPSGSILLK